MFRVALLTPGPVSDAGWNAAAYDGLQLVRRELAAEVATVQTASPADFDDAFRDFASRHFDLIFAHGFEPTQPSRPAATFPPMMSARRKRQPSRKSVRAPTSSSTTPTLPAWAYSRRRTRRTSTPSVRIAIRTASRPTS